MPWTYHVHSHKRNFPQLSVVDRPANSMPADRFLYCGWVNLVRFTPIYWDAVMQILMRTHNRSTLQLPNRGPDYIEAVTDWVNRHYPMLTVATGSGS